MRSTVVPLLVLCASLGWAKTGAADPNCKPDQRATLVSLQGTVFFDADSKGQWRQARLDEAICQNGRVRVEPYSRASLSLPNGVVLRLDEGTILSLHDITPDEPTALDLLKGFVHFISRTPKHLEITSPIANAGPEGTEFAMQVDDSKASLWVYEGAVRFFNPQGSIRLTPGQGADALSGQAPQSQIEIKPQDAVNWALYYPPILPYPKPSANIDDAVRTAIEDFRRGRVDQALLRLDRVAPEQQTPYFFKVRGAVRLTGGRVALAQEDIRNILGGNPNDAEALALQSVLALTQNRKEEALQLANKAVESDASSPAAYSALSYAEQGRFDLDKALAAAEQATRYAPHDAMVWARKAEIELARGATAESQQAAQRALELDAGLERTQTVTGFSYLLRMETATAKQAFEQALKLDSTSPLARLGLGLAKIRDGDLEKGRHDIEIAAILDPNNSLIRSYLGKAYYEEKRNALAEDQFRLAQERDPKDPTPYFYDALKKQTENKPVEALQDLQKSIALNDNRAVYRSKQLLDNDLAIRNTSLARIYNDLGFDKRATVEATRSLAIDPSNYSAHRFLSDTYVRLPRSEIAQVSELLQSQLLQPLNNNPIQPHLSVKGLNTHAGLGPVEPSFKDFTDTFQRNRPQFFASGITGSFGTYGDEAVLSGIHDKVSYSVGQYHFDTDGFRKDANITHNVYNAFLQSALSPDLNLQFEFRHRQTDQGDTRLLLTNDAFINPEERTLEQTTGRTGLNVSLTPNSHLLGSLIYSNRKESFNHENPSRLGSDKTQVLDDRNGIEAESQYLYDGKNLDFVFGGGVYNTAAAIDTDKQTLSNDETLCQFLFQQSAPCAISSSTEKTKGHITSYSFYNYNTITFPKNINWTLGLNYEIFHDSEKKNNPDDRHIISPKLGLQWFVTDWLRVRGVYLGTYKRQLIVDQTIEPTQVAGFNQFYDDFNGSRTTLKGAGIDANAGSNIFYGVEFFERDIHLPDRTALESSLQGYLNWAIHPSWSTSIEDRYECYTVEKYSLETNQLPLTLKYFNNTGFFAQVSPTLV